jgi:hypothetical protein
MKCLAPIPEGQPKPIMTFEMINGIHYYNGAPNPLMGGSVVATPEFGRLLNELYKIEFFPVNTTSCA